MYSSSSVHSMHKLMYIAHTWGGGGGENCFLLKSKINHKLFSQLGGGGGEIGDIMVLVWSPSPPQPPHAKACVSRNCDTNARIKLIFDRFIDDLEWKNPIDFGDNRKKQNGRHFMKIG